MLPPLVLQKFLTGLMTLIIPLFGLNCESSHYDLSLVFEFRKNEISTRRGEIYCRKNFRTKTRGRKGVNMSFGKIACQFAVGVNKFRKIILHNSNMHRSSEIWLQISYSLAVFLNTIFKRKVANRNLFWHIQSHIISSK